MKNSFTNTLKSIKSFNYLSFSTRIKFLKYIRLNFSKNCKLPNLKYYADYSQFYYFYEKQGTIIN